MPILRLLAAVLAAIWSSCSVVGARFLLLLVDTNSGSDLVQWIYQKSEFWVDLGIVDFRNEAVEGTGGTFEPASVDRARRLTGHRRAHHGRDASG